MLGCIYGCGTNKYGMIHVFIFTVQEEESTQVNQILGFLGCSFIFNQIKYKFIEWQLTY